MRRYNLHEPELTDEEDDPDGFRTALHRSAGVGHWEGQA
jgi:hypothetical protein